MIKSLWKFYWDCGRSGDVEGLFFETRENIEKNLGSRVYFGEILGKHSEVYGTLEMEDLKEVVLTEDISDILVKELGITVSGYNPMNYIRRECEKCGDSFASDEFNSDTDICYYCEEEAGSV